MADFSPGTGKNNSSKLNTEIQESVEDRSGSFEDETVPGTSVPEEETAAGADGHSASRRKEKDRNKAASGGVTGEGTEATAGEKEAADGRHFVFFTDSGFGQCKHICFTGSRGRFHGGFCSRTG